MSSQIPSPETPYPSELPRRAVLTGMGAAALGTAMLGVTRTAVADVNAVAGETGTWRFDFGPGEIARGATQVTAATSYTTDLGYG